MFVCESWVSNLTCLFGIILFESVSNLYFLFLLEMCDGFVRLSFDVLEKCYDFVCWFVLFCFFFCEYLSILM